MSSRPNVTVSDLQPDSLLHRHIGPGDFVDCYTVEATATPRAAAEIVATFPDWAQFLLVIRRIVTTPFGLSNDGPDAVDKIGPFPVEAETEKEIIAGFNDRHLDFRVAVYCENGRVSLSTWVHPHNIGGRIYLATIMPFHIMISRDALRRVAASAATSAA